MERTVRVASNEAAPAERDTSVESMDALLRHLPTHHLAVRRTLRALGVPDAELDDVADRVFDVAVRRWSDFDGRDLPAWLRAIARKKASRYHRAAWLRRHLLWWYAADLPGASAAGPDPEQFAAQNQERKILQAALRRIPPNFATAFTLFEIDHLSLREIAQHEGIPEATVKTRIHRGRAELQKVLRKMMAGDGGLR